MAVLYVDSGASGTPTSPYSTFNTAAASISTALNDAACVAGSTIFVASTHFFTTASVISYGQSGLDNDTSPIRVISVDKTTCSDTSTVGGSADGDYAAGAEEECTGATPDIGFGLDPDFNHLQFFGVTFNCRDLIYFNNDTVLGFEDCTLEIIDNTASTDTIGFSLDDVCVFCRNCTFGFGAAGQSLTMGADGGRFSLIGCSIEPGGTAPNALFTAPNPGAMFIEIEDCDFSGMASGGDLIGELPVNSGDGTGLKIHIANTRLPTSGSVNSASFAEAGSRIEAYNVSAGDEIFRVWIEDLYGKTLSASGTYLNATALESTVPYSLEMSCTADSVPATAPHRVRLATFTAATANPTVTVNVIHEEQGAGTAGDLQDDEFWVEVQYPDATYGSHGKLLTSRPNPNATPSDLTNNTESWTEDLAGTVVKQEVSITVSGGQAGEHTVWACLATGSASTVYVDPDVEIS